MCRKISKPLKRSGRGRIFLEQRQRLADNGLQLAFVLQSQRHKLAAHLRIPEFPEMIGRRRDGALFTLRLEKVRDLVRHVDELLVRCHGTTRSGWVKTSKESPRAIATTVRF